MLTAASSWRECTGCFCLASPFNLAFTWAMEITLHINNCPVKCAWNVASSESRRSSIIGLPAPTHCSPFPSHRRWLAHLWFFVPAFCRILSRPRCHPVSNDVVPCQAFCGTLRRGRRNERHFALVERF